MTTYPRLQPRKTPHLSGLGSRRSKAGAHSRVITIPGTGTMLGGTRVSRIGTPQLGRFGTSIGDSVEMAEFRAKLEPFANALG